jgi:hypothetical protein
VISFITDSDQKIRSSALRRVGELGGASEISTLAARLAQADRTAERDSLEQALSAIASRTEPPTAASRPLVAAANGAQGASKAALLRVLGVVGDAAALKTVRSAFDYQNPEVRGAALSTLSTWKSPDVAPELLAIAKSTETPGERLLCLRGYFGWVRNPDLPLERRIAMCAAGAELVRTTEEQKLLLGAAGTLRSAEALGHVSPYVGNPEVKEEAAAAAISVADALFKGPTDASTTGKIRELLEQVLESNPQDDVRKRVEPLLREARNRSQASQ